MNRLLYLSGIRLAQMIRDREVTSEEVTDAHIERIWKVNPSINAVVKDRFNEARAEAREADAKTKTTPVSKLPPFHGVPCTIKECFALTGMPNTAGLPSRKGLKVTQDAVGVDRLRKAGAIPMGVTNTSELCMWMESDNAVYGRTNNPYDTRRIVGGSSGGEGAIIATGGSPFGLGSDVGGSIRLPAFFNGVFGHKPSSHLVPNFGQWPIAHGPGLSYLTTGPIARRADDLWPLLKILAGPHPSDHACKPVRLGDPSTVNFKKLTVHMMEDNGAVSVSREMKLAVRRAAMALESRGATIRETRFKGLKYSFPIWSAMMATAGGPTFEEMMSDGTGLKLTHEAFKLALRSGHHTFPALALAGLERVTRRIQGSLDKWVKAGRDLKEELTHTIGPNGLMLFPPYSRTAPYHRVPYLLTLHWQYTAIFNVMEFPVTQVPMGLGRSGLPLGVQVIGIHGNDHTTIAAALELEKEFGGWQPPSEG
ncbi:MAG: amidase [Myxococcota bacterium]|jgi:fatty acid amide hydrolase 2